MTEPKSRDEEERDKKAQADNAKIRENLSNAYAALLAEQNTASFSSFTFEEALDLQLERIEGSGTEKRPNLKDRVSRIESLLVQAVDQAKLQDPKNFVEKDEERDVNTPNE